MERCAQCGETMERLPMVCLLSVDEAATLPNGPVPLEIYNNICAVGVCSPCHQNPRLPGTFFDRMVMGFALAHAGRPNLQM